MKKEIKKVMHEVKLRTLKVAKITDLSPNLRRITLSGEELVGFNSLSPEDHVKVFFPTKNGEMPIVPNQGPNGLEFNDSIIMRDYTPRSYRADKNELDLDFALHKNGPASLWAARASLGDPIVIGGPRGSSIYPEFSHYLLIGDNTSMASIFRRIEETSNEKTMTAIILVENKKAEIVSALSHENLEIIWLHHNGDFTKGLELIKKTLRRLNPEPLDTLVLISGESSIVKELKLELVENYSFDEEWVKATAYWKK